MSFLEGSILTQPRKLFLVDGLGALLSCIWLGIILVQFEQAFGMPKRVLYILATISMVFCIYSIACWAMVRKSWRRYLRMIAIANLLYCCLTIGMVLYHWHYLTAIGIIYFEVEIILVVILAYTELKNTLAYREQNLENG